MKIGDLIRPLTISNINFDNPGIIIGFNKKGEGGKEFVHVLAADGTVMMFNAFDIEVINEK